MPSINLGCGYKKTPGFINIDDDPHVQPDILLNLEREPLPFEDSTIEAVQAHHILEHIGDGYIPLLKEIYRVCQNGATIDVLVPHHFHEVFINDPTHRRPITVEGFRLFSQAHNRAEIARGGTSSCLGIKYDIDLEIESFDFKFDGFYDPLFANIRQQQEAGTLSPGDAFAFQRLLREAVNVAIETHIVLRVVK